MGIYGILWVFYNRVNTKQFDLLLLINELKKVNQNVNILKENFKEICQINYKPGSVI